jgi:hypothetical protein
MCQPALTNGGCPLVGGVALGCNGMNVCKIQ